MKKKKENGKWKEGEATQKLSQLIPPENLKLYEAAYKILKQTCLERPSYYRERYLSYMKDIYDKTKAMLALFKGDKEIVNTAITKYMLKHESLQRSALLTGLLGGYKKKKGNVQKNFCLDFLLHAITYDLRCYPPHKPQYKLVADFLVEQGIDSASLSDSSTLKKHISRIKVDNMVHMLINVYLAVDAKWLTKAQDECGCNRIYYGFLYKVYKILEAENKKLGISIPQKAGT